MEDGEWTLGLDWTGTRLPRVLPGRQSPGSPTFSEVRAVCVCAAASQPAGTEHIGGVRLHSPER